MTPHTCAIGRDGKLHAVAETIYRRSAPDTAITDCGTIAVLADAQAVSVFPADRVCADCFEEIIDATAGTVSESSATDGKPSSDKT